MAGVLAAVFVREELEEEEEGLAISSRGRVWWGGGLYCATERTGFSFAALSKLASLSIRNLRRKRERERRREREGGERQREGGRERREILRYTVQWNLSIVNGHNCRSLRSQLHHHTNPKVRPLAKTSFPNGGCCNIQLLRATVEIHVFLGKLLTFSLPVLC